MLWYNDLTGFLHHRVESVDLTPILPDLIPEISSRTKTVDTLTEKLIRHPTYQLPNIQDISGARLECDMTLKQQTNVANALAAALADVAEVEIKDYRTEAHSGYRAVHLWLTFTELKARAEVQIRTHLQAAWANAYEQAADRFGRDIRYGAFPEEEPGRAIVELLQQMSTDSVAEIESLQESVAESLERLKAAKMPRAFKGGPDKRQVRRHKRRMGLLRVDMEDTALHVYALKKENARRLLLIKDALKVLRAEGE